MTPLTHRRRSTIIPSQPSTVNIGSATHPDDVIINDRPDTEAPQSKKFQETKTDLTQVKPVHAEGPEKHAEQKSGGLILVAFLPHRDHTVFLVGSRNVSCCGGFQWRGRRLFFHLR